MLKLLITGATGFIGRAVFEEALQHQYDIALFARRPKPNSIPSQIPYFQGSFENIPLLIQILNEYKPDWVIHCAGSGSVPLSVENPAEDFRNSATLNQNLLEAIRLSASRPKLAMMSSAALYGNPKTLPISENTPIAPLSPYGWHRSIAEQLFFSYQQGFGVEGVICRIFSAYGENLQKQVVFDCFKKMVQNSKICEFWGTGEETRDFIYAKDLANAILMLCEKNARGVFNIANGEQVKIKDLVQKIKFLTKSTSEIYFNGYNRLGDPLNWEADISKLEKFGFTPSISISEGIERTWKWLQHKRPH